MSKRKTAWTHPGTGEPQITGYCPDCAARATARDMAQTVIKTVDAIGLPGSTLLEAEALVNGERAAAYGPWEDNAHNAAKIFCGMTGIVLTADEVTKLLIALKWARDRTNPKRDNVTDANGYGELLQKMREGRP